MKKVLHLLSATLVGVVFANTAVASSENVSVPAPQPIDANGVLTRAELLERVQWIAWDQAQPPIQGDPQGWQMRATGAILRTITGGAGRPQDIVSPTEPVENAARN